MKTFKEFLAEATYMIRTTVSKPGCNNEVKHKAFSGDTTKDALNAAHIYWRNVGYDSVHLTHNIA